MANTPNFALYKPSRADSGVEVDVSLTDNFVKIDTELKTNKDGLDTHKTDVNAHASDKITHADGSVKTTLDNHEERLTSGEVAQADHETRISSNETTVADHETRLTGVEGKADDIDNRVTDIETLGLDILAPNLEGRLATVESDVEGFLAPATFDAMDSQSYTFDEYRIGYVDNKIQADVGYVKKNKPTYRGAAISYGETTSTTVAKLKEYNCQAEVVVFVSVPDINSTTFSTKTTAEMDSFFTLLDGVDIPFMVIHLVKNFDDGSLGLKDDIRPSTGQEATWFANYEQAVRFYMNYAQSHGITRFSIANENHAVSTDSTLLPYWITMINNLKASYPSIQLSYNAHRNDYEIFIDNQTYGQDNLMNHLDFICINTYPSVSDNATYTGNEVMSKNLSTVSLLNVMRALNTLTQLFNKEIFISEVGCTKTDASLFSPINAATGTNTTIQAIYYNIILNSLAVMDNIKGLFVWSMSSSPFNFAGTTAEPLFKEYMAKEVV